MKKWNTDRKDKLKVDSSGREKTKADTKQKGQKKKRLMKGWT